jgi:N6-adenosine-specific RNA methylase IME4
MEKIDRDIIPYEEKIDYPTMSIEEIKNVKIPATKDGCHIYLWTTHRFLPDAFEVLKAWGADYQCCLVWDKKKGMTPFSWMYSCEFVLFGRIGSLPLLKNGEKTVFEGVRREHSRKPIEFYELVKKVSPGPRIDMFSREKHEGFEQWGNETNKF